MRRLVGSDAVVVGRPGAPVGHDAGLAAGTTDVLSGSPLAGHPALLLLALVTITAAALGVLISLQAYRGYRQARSRRLLFLAVGVVLLTLVPFLLTVAAAVLAGATTLTDLSYPVALVTRTAEVLGLLAVLYSLQQG
jgi:hypothetical protein